ncbi:hypothetical protein HDU82_006715 [Entophlyctis luteolus]|nr:hypothetical protein HDU82_006715 [Entophlyctis luteolus]
MGQKHSTSRDNKSLTLPARIVVSTKQPENVSTPPARSGGDQSDLTSIVSAKAIDWSTIDPENRRAYHNLETSIYMLPDEESEQKRLMIQSQSGDCRHIVVPEIRQFPNKARIILDVGCASGIWMESLFFGGNLHSRFHGVDITLNPSDFGTVCGAEIASGDVTQTLPYPDSKFDYVHQRALVAGVPKEKWPHVIRELIRVTKSGGWIELVERLKCDASFKSVGENAKFFSEKMEFALSARGVDTNLVNNLPDYVLACPNLINFGHKVVKIPVGWGGEIGELSAQDARSGLVHLGDFLKKSLGVDEEEYLKMVGAAAAEWSKTQAYGEWVGVWAQVMK